MSTLLINVPLRGDRDKWVNSNRKSVKDSEGGGWKISASGAYFVAKVREYLESGGRFICEELDLNHGTVHSFFSKPS